MQHMEVDRTLLEFIILRIAPEELPLLDSILDSDQAVEIGKAEPGLSFGVSLPDLAFIAPMIVSVLAAIYDAIGQKLLSAGVDIGKDVLSDRIRKWLNGKSSARIPSNNASYTVEQLGYLRTVAIEVGATRGLSEKKSSDLADAIVGYLVSHK